MAIMAKQYPLVLRHCLKSPKNTERESMDVVRLSLAITLNRQCLATGLACKDENQCIFYFYFSVISII